MGQGCCRSVFDENEEVDHLRDVDSQPLLDPPGSGESHDDHTQCRISVLKLEKQIAQLKGRVEKSELQEELSGRRVRDQFLARVFNLPKSHQSEFRDLIVHYSAGDNEREVIEQQAVNTNPEPSTEEERQPIPTEDEAIPTVRHQIRCLKKVGSPKLVPSAEQVVNKLTAILVDKNIELNVANYPDGAQSVQGPVLVFCAAFDRDVASDAGLALAGVEGSEEVLLVVMHHVQNRPALPNYSSAESLQHLKLKSVVDVVFFQGEGVYECQQNRNAVERLSQFFESQHVQCP